MSCILHIETSTQVCSVAVSEDSQVIFQQEDHSGPNHAERLGTMVDEALSFTDNHAIPFDAVAVSWMQWLLAAAPARTRDYALACQWRKASAMAET